MHVACSTLLGYMACYPQHTYLDYSITNLLAAVLIALTFGQICDGKPSMPNFITQLHQVSGVFLCLGTLAIQYAWALVGLPVTDVTASSITVVIGTTLNYFLDDRINKAAILFPGVACFLIAVLLGSAVHVSNGTDNKAKLSSYTDEVGAIGISGSENAYKHTDGNKDLEDGNVNVEKVEVGTADFLIELENTRAIKVGVVSIIYNDSMNGQVCSPFSCLHCVFLLFGFLFYNCYYSKHHLHVLNLPQSSLKAYVNDWNGRNWALLAGLICGFGNGLHFMGGQAAGYAAANAVQAFPLVSIFWGILLFGEYRKSSKRTYALLVSMLLMFIVAVAILMASSGSRRT
ncbi:hypothetical protein MKX01_034178 [Papaver californicum]|nr:hypothetical protein MKX01_034178 [Papaver californicum]